MVHVFILNPEYTDREFAEHLRQKLARIPDLTYYVFMTGAAGDETKLASMIEDIFQEDQLRIYSCGGIYSARRVLAGINDISKRELAIIPTEPVHFLEAFGSQEAFADVEAMVAGNVTRVDYIRTNHGVALNSVTFGLESYAYRGYDNLFVLRVMGRRLIWILANLYALMLTPNYMYSIDIEKKPGRYRAMEVSIYNVPITSSRIVFSDDWNVSDGLVKFMLVSRFGIIGRLVYAFRASRRKIAFREDDPRNMMCDVSTVKVRHENGVPIWGCLDGSLINAIDWNIDVVKHGLKLVIPARYGHEEQ